MSPGEQLAVTLWSLLQGSHLMCEMCNVKCLGMTLCPSQTVLKCAWHLNIDSTQESDKGKCQQTRTITCCDAKCSFCHCLALGGLDSLSSTTSIANTFVGVLCVFLMPYFGCEECHVSSKNILKLKRFARQQAFESCIGSFCQSRARLPADE